MRSPRYVATITLGLAACAAFEASSNSSGGGGSKSNNNNNVQDASNDASLLPDAARIVRGACSAKGIDPTSPWPMRAGCVTREGRSALQGPKSRPKEQWRQVLRGADRALAPPVLDSNGTMYLGVESNASGFRAVFADGGVAWEHDAGNVSEPAAIAADGTIVFAAGPANRGVFRVASGGQLLQHWRFDGELDNSILIADDGTILTASQSKGSLIAIKGQESWFFDAGSPPRMAALAADGTIVFSTNDLVLAVRLNGGVFTKKWALPVTSPEAPVVSGDLVYVTSGDGKLFARKLTDGTSVFGPITVAGTAVSRPAIMADGTILIGDRAGDLHVFDRGGAPKLEETIVAPARVCAATIDASGWAYFTVATNVTTHLVGIDIAMPSNRWTLDLGFVGDDPGCYVEPVIADDETLLLLTTDATLRAYHL